MAWGALGQAAGAIGGEALNIGSSIGGAAFNAYLTRDLRRTAYQDQMHSMRQAGLNPMLAAGATPGYSNTGTAAVKTDFGGTAQKVGQAMSASAQRELLQAQREVASNNAVEAKAKADAAVAMAQAQIRSLNASAADKEQEAATGLQREHQVYTQTMLGRQQWRANEPGARVGLLNEQAARVRAELVAGIPDAVAEYNRRQAGLASAREVGQGNSNVISGVDARWVEDFETMIRMGKTYDQIVDRLGPVADIVLKGRSLRSADRRDRNANARDAQRQENDWYRARQQEREQDRRDRAERRNYPSEY